MSARSWDASEEDMVKRGDWRDSEAARTEATTSSQEKQKLVRGIMVEVRVGQRVYPTLEFTTCQVQK